jgi:hypothetical protein
VYANASCQECLPHEVNTEYKINGYVVFKININGSEPAFVNLLRSPGIDFQPGGIMGFLNVYKYGLRWAIGWG